jgi:hypothetical protein
VFAQRDCNVHAVNVPNGIMRMIWFEDEYE